MGAPSRTLMCPECGKPYIRGGNFCAHCGSLRSSLDLDLADSDSDVTLLPPGTMIGSYRVLELLGRGGMGFVYTAEHIKLGRRVALKKLRRELASNPKAVARFFAEARAVNRISHENIVEITDLLEQPGGDNFIIMELLKGEDLGQRLRRTRVLPLSRSLDIVAQTASALAAVHSAGMIHRDLKPDNIFLTERRGSLDFVKVLDFGVAKLTDVDGKGGIAVHTTAAGQIIGTPEYMSPEQACGAPVDHRTDIYALGVILYEMITGAVPFQAKNFGELMIKHMSSPVKLPPKQPGVPYGVQSGRDDLLLDLLAKDPNDRPRSMDDVEVRIRTLLDTMEVLQEVKRRTPAGSDLIATPERAAAKEPEPPRNSEAVAKLALVKGMTPQAAVEVATPRSVSRIEIVTPPGTAPPSVSRTMTRAVDPPMAPPRSAPTGKQRLAKSSSDISGSAPSPRSRATPPPDRDTGSAVRPESEPGATPSVAASSQPQRRTASPPFDRGRVAGSSAGTEARESPDDARRDARRGVGSSLAIPISERPSSEPALGTPGSPAEARATASSGARQTESSDRPGTIADDAPRRSGATVRRWPLAVAGGLGIAVGVAIMWFAQQPTTSSSAVPSPPAPPAAPAEVTIKFVSAPSGATVRLAGTGESLGTTPFARRFPRGDRVATFEFVKTGFVAMSQAIGLASDDAIAAELTPIDPTPIDTAPPPAGATPSVVSPGSAGGSAGSATAAPAPPPVRKRARPRRTPPADPSVDRNGTLDVFENK